MEERSERVAEESEKSEVGRDFASVKAVPLLAWPRHHTRTLHTHGVSDLYAGALSVVAVAKDAEVDAIDICEWYGLDDGGGDGRQK